MMVFSFLFVVLTLPRISLLVNVFLKIVEMVYNQKIFLELIILNYVLYLSEYWKS